MDAKTAHLKMERPGLFLSVPLHYMNHLINRQVQLGGVCRIFHCDLRSNQRLLEIGRGGPLGILRIACLRLQLRTQSCIVASALNSRRPLFEHVTFSI